MSELKKTLSWTALWAGGCGFGAFLIQLQANHAVTSCSYLDPVSVDILAIAIGVFLSAEGLVALVRNPDLTAILQSSRIARMCIGVSILTIHIMQFIHK